MYLRVKSRIALHEIIILNNNNNNNKKTLIISNVATDVHSLLCISIAKHRLACTIFVLFFDVGFFFSVMYNISTADHHFKALWIMTLWKHITSVCSQICICFFNKSMSVCEHWCVFSLYFCFCHEVFLSIAFYHNDFVFQWSQQRLLQKRRKKHTHTQIYIYKSRFTICSTKKTRSMVKYVAKQKWIMKTYNDVVCFLETKHEETAFVFGTNMKHAAAHSPKTSKQMRIIAFVCDFFLRLLFSSFLAALWFLRERMWLISYCKRFPIPWMILFQYSSHSDDK